MLLLMMFVIFFEFSTEEEIDRFIDESNEQSIGEPVHDHAIGTSRPSVPTDPKSDETETEQTEKRFPSIISDEIQKEPSSRVKLNHPSDLILGDPKDSMVTRNKFSNVSRFACFFIKY